MLDCPRSGEDVTPTMGAVSNVVDGSRTCSDAEAEAFTGTDIDMMQTAEDTLGECAFSVGTGGVEQQDGREPWVFDTGATQLFCPILVR